MVVGTKTYCCGNKYMFVGTNPWLWEQQKYMVVGTKKLWLWEQNIWLLEQKT
jgi:hypothetical protein